MWTNCIFALPGFYLHTSIVSKTEVSNLVPCTELVNVLGPGQSGHLFTTPTNDIARGIKSTFPITSWQGSHMGSGSCSCHTNGKDPRFISTFPYVLSWCT
ncbi:hypothetical protein SCLCIDRAFT_1217496 [Scleroderma citrinum Foug A]|uniref:Uncharacterized protein n=1 Tax=Scleroderma citrinum Foug A TaxID=1036808 RepID=A0A0C2ZD54_9AGAM|nr:hypothetical protein SCLCIDRAFT_1217496 [Scleroderma citrinum Foug A]